MINVKEKCLNKQELLKYLNLILLGYRDKLNFSREFTFGTEIEFENANLSLIREALSKNSNLSQFLLTEDETLNHGGEIDSPILANKIDDWKNLYDLCEILNKYASINYSSSGHIHVGIQIIGNNESALRNFCLLWITYENIIYRFLYGEYLSGRCRMLEFSKPVGKIIYDILNNKLYNDLFYYLSIRTNKFTGINFNNLARFNSSDYDKIMEKNTVEIRCPNGTLNPIVWQNNVNFIMHLFMYAKSSNFNKDIVLRRLDKNKDILSNLEYYDLIYYDQALELCNMIFDDDLDKLYFLRQYLKNNEISHESMVEAKKFTI